MTGCRTVQFSSSACRYTHHRNAVTYHDNPVPPNGLISLRLEEALISPDVLIREEVEKLSPKVASA